MLGLLLGVPIFSNSILTITTDDRRKDLLTLLLIGIGAPIVLPLLYGLIGFLSGLIGATAYNVLVHITGGLRISS